MFRNLFSFGGALVLTGAAVLLTAGASEAAPHGGGGHGGGFHAGGFHSGGGFHAGGFHPGGGFHAGGFHPGGFGGYHSGGYRGGYHYGYPHYGYGGGYRHYYPRYGYYGYGAYPFYGSYLYNNYLDSPYYASGGGYDTGTYGYDGGIAPYYPDDYTAVTPPDAGYPAYSPLATGTDQPDTIAHVSVKVPADAQVWFDDTQTTSTGPVRQFDSPPLSPGSQYSYEIRARWNDNGHEVTQTQHIGVTAGAHVNVSFPVASKTGDQATDVKKG
jgi:uncharacterized protein (TIGR03000 family)